MKPEVQDRTLEVFMDVLTSTHLPHKSSFVELFLTPTEKIMLSKRVAIAILIKRGYSYELIKEYLKVSQSTVAGIVKQLELSSQDTQYMLDKIIRHKEMEIVIGNFEYGLRTLIPPKGRDWSIWRKNLEHDKRIQDVPF